MFVRFVYLVFIETAWRKLLRIDCC